MDPPMSFTNYGKRRTGRTSHTFSNELKDRLKYKNQPVQSNNTLAGYIIQYLDNFNQSNDHQWQQLFFYNFNNSEPKNGLNFLHIGGESPISKSDVLDGVWIMMLYAKQYKAAAYSLEHRYYGQSLPTGADLSTPNLKYLSSKQALADTARFIKAVNLKRNISNPKWIVFGGSYAGNLAAWLRLKYSDLVLGAISSSAPLQAIANFTGYYRTVQKSLSQYGSHKCTKNIASFFHTAKELITSEGGRNALGICPQPLWNNEKDILQFFDDRLSEIGNHVQDDSLTHTDINEICSMYAELVDQNKTDVADADQLCVDSSYWQYIESLRDTAPNWFRGWHWQKCTEFGFFQTIYEDDRSNMFGDLTLSLEYSSGTCADVFGPEYDLQTVQKAIEEANNFYGGTDKFNATNVIFINGSEDPWRTASIIKSSPNNAYISLHIEGSSHCRDMFRPSSTNFAALNWAHNVTSTEISKWIAT
ncbi:serine carboxypeptidase s28 domain-containing protein [Ditylenchus destructor]|nr:serine carboxypeptidase s28 domain-containing protein [Ditylenchus destructor]